jgi:hypothetical protein
LQLQSVRHFGPFPKSRKRDPVGLLRSPIAVSRSIFALTDDRDRMYFARGEEGDQIGMLSEIDRAIFGRSYADEPDKLIAQLKGDEAIAEADTLLLTVPNQLAGRSPKRV